MLTLFAFALSFYACNTTEVEKPEGKYSKGFFIINEGPFQNGVGTISFFDYETKEVEDNIFEKVNERPLGSVVQSMEIYNEKGYVVVNNAEKVEVVNPHTFESEGVIKDLMFPRYFLGISENKGYITEWGESFAEGVVKVINLTDRNVEKTITVGLNPEKMVKKDNKVYVINSGSATISVINTDTDNVIATIEVEGSPNSLQIDADSHLWVLCGGNKVYDQDWVFVEEESEPGALLKVDISSNEVVLNLKFESKAASPNKLLINPAGDKLYYQYLGATYSLNTSDESLNNTAFIQKSFYGNGIFGGKNWIIGADAGDFSAKGKIYIYNLNEGSEVGAYTVGIIPNGIATHP